MNLSDSFLCDHVDVKLLVLAQKHQLNRVFLLPLSVSILDRNHRIVRIDWHDILGGDFDLVTIFANSEQPEVD